MKILIPVDGSDNANRAVEYAIKLASALREAPQLVAAERAMERRCG